MSERVKPLMKLELKPVELPKVRKGASWRVRKARVGDVDQIHDLIKYWARESFMLVRPKGQLYENLRDFHVIEDEDGVLLGSVALHILWADLAEIRSLAVHPDRQGEGLGRVLVEAAEAEAQALGIPKVFAFTIQEEFFTRLGYRITEPEAFPRKVWFECRDCPFQDNCPEVPVLKVLEERDA